MRPYSSLCDQKYDTRTKLENMSNLPTLEAAVTQKADEVRAAKASGGNLDAALSALTDAKAALKVGYEQAILELGDGADPAVLEDLQMKLEDVTPMSKGERKKLEKARKAAKKAKEAAAAGGAPAAPSKQAAPLAAGGEGKPESKSAMKARLKMEKKAAMKAANAARNENAPPGGHPPAPKDKSAGKGKPPPAAVPAVEVSSIPYAAMISALLNGQQYSSKTDEFVAPDGTKLCGSHTIARYFAYDNVDLTGGKNAAKACAIHQWTDFVLLHINTSSGLQALDAHLETNTYIVGYTMTLADVVAWGALRGSSLFDENKLASTRTHLTRWYRHCAKLNHFQQFSSAPPTVTAADAVSGTAVVGEDGKPLSKKELKKRAAAAAKAKKKAEYKAKEEVAKASGTFVKKVKEDAGGKLVELKNAKMGEVKTRFPPEPSGYLHVGHVKAIMLNDAMARKYKGKLLLRFDDTNPSKEKEEFTENIKADLKRLNIVPDEITYTSDSFDSIREYAIKMIKDGTAYMDDTPGDKMSEERNEGIASKHRDASVETNMRLFQEMCDGTEEGQKWCMRAKIDMQCKNKCMRDPVFYRSNVTHPHARTGTKYKAYPIYDLACPIVDANEGVTHAMRTTEYKDRDEMYEWTLNALGLRHVEIQEFSRINFMHTLMSKRKLQKLVDEGAVEGWNDPRFPTVQGILRRGLRVPALREFILSMGFSKRVIDMTWDKIWAMNRKFIEPDAKRYFAISKENVVRLKITNVEKNEEFTVPFHPKDPSGERCGMKTMVKAPQVFLEQQDCTDITEGEEITLIKWGNVIVKKLVKSGDVIVSLEGEFNAEGSPKATKKKIAWVPECPGNVELALNEFGHLLNVPKIPTDEAGEIIGKFEDYLATNTHAVTIAIGEPAFSEAKEDDIVQVERRGYFRVDKLADGDAVPQLFMVPDGKQKSGGLSGKLGHV